MHATAKLYTAATIHFLMQYSVLLDVAIIIIYSNIIFIHIRQKLLYTQFMKNTRSKIPVYSAVEYSNVESVHKLHYVVVQCQYSSSLMECPHKQEVFQSGLSSASYDSVHYIESLEHQVAVQQ